MSGRSPHEKRVCSGYQSYLVPMFHKLSHELFHLRNGKLFFFLVLCVCVCGSNRFNSTHSPVDAHKPADVQFAAHMRALAARRAHLHARTADEWARWTSDGEEKQERTFLQIDSRESRDNNHTSREEERSYQMGSG